MSSKYRIFGSPTCIISWPVDGKFLNRKAVTWNAALALTRREVQHKFETYDGDRGSHIKAQLAEGLLPFFTANLNPAK